MEGSAGSHERSGSGSEDKHPAWLLQSLALERYHESCAAAERVRGMPTFAQAFQAANDEFDKA